MTTMTSYLRRILVVLLIAVGLILVLPSMPAFAGETIGPAPTGTETTGEAPPTGTETIGDAPDDGICAGSGNRCTRFIEDYINPFIYLLTGLVGVVAVISIILAGIMYSGSADDPSVVSKAKQRIFNTVIGLVAYVFLLAFLNYLVPGGLFQ